MREEITAYKAKTKTKTARMGAALLPPCGAVWENWLPPLL